MFWDSRETLVLAAVENAAIESARTVKVMDYCSISLLNKALLQWHMGVIQFSDTSFCCETKFTVPRINKQI